MQFFQNIWTWFCEQSYAITNWLTPANFVLLIGNIAAIIRTVKTVRSNTSLMGNIGVALKETKFVEAVKSTEKEVAAIKAQIADMTDLMNQAITKLNAVLEVQESAYNASNLPKDTQVAIRNFIAAGKFADSKAHAAVADEITALKAQIKLVAEASEKTEERIKKLTNTAETPAKAASKPKAEGVRYD